MNNNPFFLANVYYPVTNGKVHKNFPSKWKYFIALLNMPPGGSLFIYSSNPEIFRPIINAVSTRNFQVFLSFLSTSFRR